MLKQQNNEKYLLAFGLGFFALFAVLLPLLIIDHGYFIYYGDFVSQQLPFYQLANDAVRNQGLLGWNWYTDLGSSFLGSYAFYLTGSPFFWLTVLLPEKLILYAIPWLLCLKHGIASLTAYGYIRYFVKNQNIAVIGGLLYAFSGFQIFNIFFNHFQDVTAFFPLMLIAMEEFLRNHRKGCFALSVALMAVINYFFFTGQAVFLIIYFLVRLCCKDIKITWKQFFILLLEAILGVCIACVVLLPAGLAVLENNRVSEYLFGQDMLLYNDKTKIIRIIQSFFMIPDAPARTNLFSSDSSKWASIGGYLPLFSMSGVIAFMNQKKKHWASILIWICMLCAFTPFLNSMFYLFNASYYARWYYMPILIMAMMTAHALDNAEIQWEKGLFTSSVMLVLFGVISILPVKQDDKIKFFKFASIPSYFFITLGISVICIIGAWYICKLRKQKQNFWNKAIIFTSTACVACTCSVVYFGKAIGTDAENYINTAIHGKENLSISYETDEDDYFRVDISKNYDNYPMFWGLSSMRCFQSVVSPSIMEFYDSIGINRDVASRAETEYYTLRGLFSVKYYFNKLTDSGQTETEKNLNLVVFAYDRPENGFEIYKNNYFIPMGFTYDNYILEEKLEDTKKNAREKMLIQALILNQEQAELYS
ncbi:MAG: YfhO family protein, partial [Oscillospiraceae bacterium]|nr:YfhO family protein [Oscillospiraceae bacterium]